MHMAAFSLEMFTLSSPEFISSLTTPEGHAFNTTAPIAKSDVRNNCSCAVVHGILPIFLSSQCYYYKQVEKGHSTVCVLCSGVHIWAIRMSMQSHHHIYKISLKQTSLYVNLFYVIMIIDTPSH